ncbi:lysine biosynthesis regulatory protein, putative [Candida dubliniensis CD36]|uniref:Transcription factor with zinc cluster DNA-binding motif, putative n=1 Tax=Candida dubliniensis (strain CD36 / ATCC MYA-646 / CBS 7987 / NCPF 3949 / NRRL Y-17841) TaxID=573826 RepID=B9WD49_CANDC|nr:lysine biosynthesis regulatory protein, putative [Candida dubliniensis CD36]CAX42598.1 lysine biosynthesis regulatory protein, putative [Candida dubliniensis CD36]
MGSSSPNSTQSSLTETSPQNATTTTTTTKPIKKVIKKSKYSRGGCAECRRRKIKCDELKPYCHNCTRLNKICVYPTKPKFKFETPKTTFNNANNNNMNADQASHNGNSVSYQFLDDKYNSRNLPIYFNDNETNRRLLNGSNGNNTSSLQQQNGMSFMETNNLGPLPAPPPPPPLHPQPTKKFKISDMLSPDNDNHSNTNSNNRNAYDFINMDYYNWDTLPITDLQNLFDDASLLVQDSLGLFTAFENELAIGPIGQDENDNGDNHNNDFQLPVLDSSSDKISSSNSPSATLSPSSFGIPRKLLSNKKLIEKTLLVHDIQGPHKIYLDQLTKTKLSYHVYPFAESIETNQVLRILLQYSLDSPYLLTAILATSATFQFIETRQLIHKEHQFKYTNISLKYLSEAFPQESNKDNHNSGDTNNDNGNFKMMTKDIEKLLLTILVLTLNFTALAYFQRNNPDGSTGISSVNKNNWKIHLRGVKDLLLKYSKLAHAHSNNQQYITDGLALAKTWFFAIESVAELNDPLGGTIKYSTKNISSHVDIIKTNQNVLDCSDSSRLWVETGYFNRGKNQDYHDALYRIGMVTNPNLPISTQFNMFLGFSIDVVKLIDEMTKSLDLLRENKPGQLSGTCIANIFTLISRARNNDIVPKVNKETFVIPKESIGHPEYKEFDKLVLPKSCYTHEIINDNTTGTKETIYYSWYDWSEQLHIDSVYMKLFHIKGLMKLPRDHPLVQELKGKVLTSMFFLKDKQQNIVETTKFNNVSKIFLESDHYYLHCDLFDTRAIMAQSSFRECIKIANSLLDFEKLELYFQGLIKLGNGSSLLALDNVKKFKQNFINGKSGEDDVDLAFDSEIIPFS